MRWFLLLLTCVHVCVCIRRQRPGQQAGSLGQYTSDGFFLLRAASPADSATEVGRPPMGPQGELLRDAFGAGNLSLRRSPFSGYAPVDDAAGAETAGHRINLSQARSGPVDGALLLLEMELSLERLFMQCCALSFIRLRCLCISLALSHHLPFAHVIALNTCMLNLQLGTT